ncbi:MAG: tyrosine-type recombinase/integrase [Halieaceae bacterium]|nr:tyrosine-type recombinase/integrase [Halieaceae bacterium]
MRRNNKGKVCIYHQPKRGTWRVQVTRPDGTRATQTVVTEELANEIADHLRAQLASTVQTVQGAIDMYLDELREREDTESHIVSTRARLLMMFPASDEQLLSELHPITCQRLYDEMRKSKSPYTKKPYAVDTQRHALVQSRAMCKWLVVKGALSNNPFAEVEGVGKRKKGKTQLTIDEARRFLDVCVNYTHPTMRADGRNKMRTPKLDPQVGVTAAMCCLLLAMRAGEIAALTPRSIDDGGRVLRIFRDGTKTDAGERLLEVPDVLRDRLPALAAADISRYQVNAWVHTMCKVAGVADVGPHALRGTHASLATRAGATSQLVAGSLGHASTEVTNRHYTRADAVADARVGAALTVLAGGLK